MATSYSNQLYCSNSSAANFRAWATFIHNVFMLGFVNVTDAFAGAEDWCIACKFSFGCVV